jgi:ankyrin repeat protein
MCVKLYQKNNDLYDFICDNCHKNLNIEDLPELSKYVNIKNIENINNIIIEHFTKKDSSSDFIDFLMLIQSKINKNILEMLVKYNSKNIIRELISTKIIDDYMSYYLVLMSGNVDIIEIMNFDMDIAMNFLKDIITNGIYKSFEYLIENDKSVATSLFEDNKNIFHMIKNKGDYEKIINKMMLEQSELINICDSTGETPILYHSKTNPKLLESFLKYDDIIDLTIGDNEGNTCLHFLCSHDEPKILKNILKKYPELINMPNSKSEYPVIICCKNKLEEMFFVMKNLDADLDVRDIYGNTVYHYICANSICLDMVIKNIPNFFGLTPKDYCALSHRYYHFIE